MTTGKSWERGVRDQGLAFMNAPSGSLISYATSPGSTASDGQGENGLYTEALIQNIGMKNLSVEDVFKRVRVQVKEKSGGSQIPWESTSLEGDFYFVYDEDMKESQKKDLINQISDYSKSIPKEAYEIIEIKDRGVAKADQGDYIGAIQEYNKAIELDPSYAKAYNNRGAAKHQLGDYRGAIADYNIAIKLDPELSDAYYNRGLAKVNLGDKTGACLDWSKAGELGFGDAYEQIRKNCN
jgi:tetratricopeptide (TPR) repeat protein